MINDLGLVEARIRAAALERIRLGQSLIESGTRILTILTIRGAGEAASSATLPDREALDATLSSDPEAR